MRIFITGATGYIGQRLALKLANERHVIHALVRDLHQAEKVLNHPNIVLHQGDILDQQAVMEAMQNCNQIYHLAALASVWHKNPDSFYQINVEGLKVVLDCAVANNIKDFLFTSTAGVVGHAINNQPVNETGNPDCVLETLYEKSKVKAEELIKSYVQKGVRGIIVNPSRVYGPGLLTESNAFTRLLKMYLENKWKIKPCNGTSIGNYVFIDDVLSALVNAMNHAKPGERYLLGGENASYNNFFGQIDALTGKPRKLYNVSLPTLLVLANIQLFMARYFGKKPLITPPFVRKYTKHWMVDSSKATKELNHKITPLKIGLERTLAWLNTNEIKN